MIGMPDITHAFPFGFPTQAAWEELWDQQKAHRHNHPGDNLLDQDEFWGPSTHG